MMNRSRNFIIFLLFFSICFFSNFCHGQKFSYNDNKWWLGHVKFQNGDSLYVRFQYNMETELVSIKRPSADSLINVFPTSQINSLVFYDPQYKYSRFIYSKLFVDKNNFEKERLFELIYRNNSQLYFREQNINSDWVKIKVLMKQQFLFYLSFDNGNTLVRFSGKQKDFLNLLPSKKAEMASYIKSRNPDLHTYDDLVSALMYYDSLLNKR